VLKCVLQEKVSEFSGPKNQVECRRQKWSEEGQSGRKSPWSASWSV